MFTRIISISVKEFRQIFRDKRSLLIIFLLPVSLLALFGYAISIDVENIKLGVFDKDNSETSRKYLSSLDASAYFTITDHIRNDNEVNELLNNGKIYAAIVIPDNFEKEIQSDKNVMIQYIVDGVDASTAGIVQNYLLAVTYQFNSKIVTEELSRKGIKSVTPLNAEMQFWYNKDLDSTLFFIPGLIAMILIIITVILTSISLVREKEFSTIEQIRISPVSSLQLILGKITPYLILSLFIAASILLMGGILFGVEVKGSYMDLFIGTVCYLLATLSMGVFISTIAESQQVAFQISQLISQLPTIIFSGFIFPIESMPYFIQLLSNITPSKYFIIILRNILIKGTELSVYIDQIYFLLIFSAIFIFISAIRIKREQMT
ncbi:MAG: ABC transporter permease [Ignavibacteria bacterium]|nr:ABC transporter permease [Ignavibacteria bacterium]